MMSYWNKLSITLLSSVTLFIKMSCWFCFNPKSLNIAMAKTVFQSILTGGSLIFRRLNKRYLRTIFFSQKVPHTGDTEFSTWCVRIVETIPKRKETGRNRPKREKVICHACHMRVTCHLSLVTNTNSHSHILCYLTWHISYLSHFSVQVTNQP